MRIVFMGTPEFSIPALLALHSSEHEIKYAITQQDKPKDRGKKLQYTPVKEKALELGMTVLQPEKLKNNTENLELLKAYAPDLIVVVAYGQLLPPEIINLPRFGCINIHASLLPKHRGAAPIQRSIMDGDEVTGVTIMHMAEGLDTGDMIASNKTAICRKTYAELHDELSKMGAALLMETLPAILQGTAQRTAQDETLSTYAPMIFKKDGELDFSKEPKVLDRLIRALNPHPGAFTTYNGVQMKIWEAFALEIKNSEPHGTITDVSDEGISVSTGGKTLRITAIQFPGKRSVSVKEYLKGNKIEKFAVLG